MESRNGRTDRGIVDDALACMERALELLDEAGVPSDIGAHLDLAICKLRDALPGLTAGRDLARTTPISR
jgi:hypothetical protein